MDNQILYKFMEELRQQCRFAQLAFQQLKASLNTLNPEKAFLFAQAFLGHAGMVSRLLWPERPESKERGECLRKELNVGDDSVLVLREIRRQMENPDERYEDWLNGLTNRNYVDMNVMPVAAIGEFKEDAFQRNLDPDTFKMHLRGGVCDLKSTAEALRKLESSLQYWLRGHQPW
jgi:hypothetical protein